jgi:UDPglucose 6-dehydrogenase
MRLVVFGAGYVGLVTGTGLADLGHDVLVVDIDATRVEKLNAGEIPIYEPGLGELVRRNRRSGRLRFDVTLNAESRRADAYFIAVGTPQSETGAADVSQVFAVAEHIAANAQASALVVVKSTVPVGTCDLVLQRLRERARPGVHLEIASNPEFLKEGDALSDFFKPERIVIGVKSDQARDLLRTLYAPLQLSGERVVVTDPRSSELIKYAANALLAMRVSFMNELSRLCHATGADIHSVRMGVGTDSRIGKKFLYAGPGYGGSCFPKDVMALAALGRAHGVPMRLAIATHEANEEQTSFIYDLVVQAISNPQGKRVALWGLAFKPETDDVRESPALKLARQLIDAGCTVVGHDPEASGNFLAALGDRRHGASIVAGDYEALDNADTVVLLTEWRSYRAPNFTEIRKRLRGHSPCVVDARNIWRPHDVQRAGLRYLGVGVPAAPAAVVMPPQSSRSVTSA